MSKNTTKNTSGVKGVGWSKKNTKWIANIMIMGRNKYLGSYENFWDAVKARFDAEQRFLYDDESPAARYIKKHMEEVTK